MKTETISSRLFARPSITEGVARLFDFGATLQEYNTSETEAEADTKALRNDWRAVGNDFRHAINKHEQEFARTTK